MGDTTEMVTAPQEAQNEGEQMSWCNYLVDDTAKVGVEIGRAGEEDWQDAVAVWERLMHELLEEGTYDNGWELLQKQFKDLSTEDIRLFGTAMRMLIDLGSAIIEVHPMALAYYVRHKDDHQLRFVYETDLPKGLKIL